MSHWKHELRITKVRGHYKGDCPCGWQSPKTTNEEQVREEYRTHTKLVEREARRAAEGS